MCNSLTPDPLKQNYSRTLLEEVFIESDANTLRLNFTQPGEYQVFQGADPQYINWDAPLKVTTQKLELPRKCARPFFGIITPAQEKLLVAERKIIFSGLDNFRDLGGIKTQDKRYVSWGNFYRSDALCNLQTSEFSHFENLNIKKVFDLRSDFELKTAKDNLPQQVAYLHFPIFADNNSGMLQGMQQKMEQGVLTVSDAEELLIQANQSFAVDDVEKFKNLLHQFFSENLSPLLFHCTAGKDRTGFTAALILALLNVDKQTILAEYEMTNFYTQQKLEKLITGYMHQASSNLKIEPHAIEILMSVDKKYLNTAFDVIEKQYGGIDAYLKNQLGFSDDFRAAIISKYTYKL